MLHKGSTTNLVKSFGVAHNSTNEQANAVQAFLISSIAGRMREIVALVPVK